MSKKQKFSKTIMTLEEYTQGKIYNHIIIEFCEVFEIDLFSDIYFKNPDNKNLSNNRVVKPQFFNDFMRYKKEMIAYQTEKYSWKSIIELAAYHCLDVSAVVTFIEEIKDTLLSGGDISNLEEDRKVGPNTRFKAISSFEIQKKIQAENRQKLLRLRFL